MGSSSGRIDEIKRLSDVIYRTLLSDVVNCDVMSVSQPYQNQHEAKQRYQQNRCPFGSKMALCLNLSSWIVLGSFLIESNPCSV